ncbi:MAG: helix-turn-helix transcriptional regulator [Pseudomonadota bacterium]
MAQTVSTVLFSAMAGIIVFALASAWSQAERRRDQVWSLTALLVILLINTLGELVMATEFYRVAPHLAGPSIPVRVALGPALYVYVCSMVARDRYRFGGKDWMALIGPLFVVLISLPFFVLSAEEKLALADPVTRDAAHFRLALVACIGGMLTFLVVTAAYLVAAFRLQAQHRALVKTEYANIEKRSLDWLRVMLLVWGAAWLIYAGEQTLWFAGLYSAPLSVALALIETSALAVFAHLALHQPVLAPQREEAPAPREPILSAERMERVAARLTSALSAERFFAEPDLSLQRLSGATGISKNHISETLSQHLGTNFFDFVNRHRVADAQRLIAETDTNLLGIAIEVGFNSRSTFNAAFKKHAGLTPSAYRASLSGAGPAASVNPAPMASE